MKKILITLLVVMACHNAANSQGRNAEMRANKNSADQSNKIFNDGDVDFKVTDVPEKWKGESAVIIAQKFDYEYTAEGKRTLSYKETTRRRIKLLDKAAIEKFSTFYYYGVKNESVTKAGDGFGIQITKPDGKVRKIEKKDAIKVETGEVATIYKARFYGVNFQYYKVAIADLEPGDILDYYLVTTGGSYNFTGEPQALPPVIATMNSDYSIINQKINFVVDRGFFVNFKGTNGAPELKKNPAIDRNTYSFSLVDNDRNKIDDTRWLYEYRELPTMKFQVCFSRIGADTKYFLGKVDEPTTSVSMQEVATKINFWYTENQMLADYYIDAIKARMRTDHGKPTNKEDIIKWCYYYFRNIAFSSTTFSNYSASELGYMPSPIFAKVMVELLANYDIQADVCVAPDRDISRIEDVVLSAELNWFIKVGNNFIFTFNENSDYKNIDDDLQGQDAYIIKIDKREANQTAQKTKVPVNTAIENYAKYSYTVSVDDNMENLKVVAITDAKGNSKSFYNPTALSYYDWEKTDYLAYGGKKPEEEKVESRNKNKIAEAERQKAAKAEEQQKNKLDLMKEELKGDFDNVVSYDSFVLDNDGRRPDANSLVYTEKYVLGDLVKKAGPNYSVEIGKLIGGQIAIDKKEVKRDYNIWLNFARTADFKIIFDIPAGYKADGLDALKSNIDNNTGTFTVSTSVEGQQLTVVIKKAYKNNYFVKEDWPKMVEFLDAAYNFTQKKIILTKSK